MFNISCRLKMFTLKSSIMFHPSKIMPQFQGTRAEKSEISIVVFSDGHPVRLANGATIGMKHEIMGFMGN